MKEWIRASIFVFLHVAGAFWNKLAPKNSLYKSSPFKKRKRKLNSPPLGNEPEIILLINTPYYTVTIKQIKNQKQPIQKSSLSEKPKKTTKAWTLLVCGEWNALN